MQSKYVQNLIQKYAFNSGKRKEFVEKLISNFLWHLTPTKIQVKRMQTLLEQFSLKGMFFITANLLEDHPERIELFQKHEIAPHGYRHIDYSMMSADEAYKDMKQAIHIFKKNQINPYIFRAPYATPKLKDSNEWYHILKSTGIQYSSSQLRNSPPYHPIRFNKGVTEFPIIYPTDDALIQYSGIKDPKKMIKELLKKIYEVSYCDNIAAKTGNILVFCLHPLRIGQVKYLPVLENLLHGIDHLPDYELESFKDAIRRWKEGDTTNLVVISGDIDCWSFKDYLLRLRYT